jgi:hypothetical protein
MARKTAMGKESEKDRLRGGGQRMPGKPRPMDDKGNFTDKQSLERVSPGVYRNSQGKLVGSKGQTLPKRSPIQNALQGAAQAAGQQTGMQANIQGNLQAAGMEGGRMPAGQPGQQFSQREIDAGMEAQKLAESFMAQYPSEAIPNCLSFLVDLVIIDQFNQMKEGVMELIQEIQINTKLVRMDKLGERLWDGRLTQTWAV